MLNRNPFPTTGELVICKVINVDRVYVRVSLEDYGGLKHEKNASGMIHIKELSNRWVKNINSIISVGQKVVLSVLRVNEERGYLDLSLRRVNKVQRTNTMGAWRYSIKLEGLLKFFAEQNNLSLQDLYEKALWAIIDEYGDLRSAFEDVKEEGIDILKNIPNLELSDDLIQALYQLILENVTISKVNINVEFQIQVPTGNGIDLIKEAIAASIKLRKAKGISIKFSYSGAPAYRCELEAKDYPSAENHLTKIKNKMESIIGTTGTVEMIRV
ncbi:MAG: S1 RNA-binding domain-containing protein [Promethearchaeota archaeon]